MSNYNLKSNLDPILTDNEKVAIQKFYDDEETREAVKKIILFTLYHNGTIEKGLKPEPTRNAAFSLIARGEFTNEQIGQDLRGLWEGVKLIENAFDALSVYKSDEEKKVEKKKNPAL